MSNVAERILAFNKGRDPELLQLKYHTMRSDAFAFLRGTCHLFYEDWPADSALNNAPPAWICGDLHWQNLGSYKGDNWLVYFQINDFDEAVLAPCTWDLARLLVSLVVGAKFLQCDAPQAEALCAYFLDEYAKEVAKGRIELIHEEDSTGVVRELLFQVRTRNRAAFLDSRTTLVEGVRRLRIDGKHTRPITEGERANVLNMMQNWAKQQVHPQFFTVLDVAHRVAGVGSLGVDRYVLLVEGKGSPDRNYLLDLKAEQTSSLQPYLPTKQPDWHEQAERVVTIQQWVQGVPPALLSAVKIGGGSYVLRELQPQEDKVHTELLQGKVSRLEKLVETIARVVAWGQLRSGGQQGAEPAYALMTFIQQPHWQKALLKYVQAYANQVEEDYQEYCAAYDKGVFSSAS